MNMSGEVIDLSNKKLFVSARYFKVHVFFIEQQSAVREYGAAEPAANNLHPIFHTVIWTVTHCVFGWSCGGP